MMLISLLGTLILLAWLDRVTRIGRLETEKLKARFAFFALRDRLRVALIQREMTDDQWFKFLDTTITRSADSIEHLNVWEGLAAALDKTDQTRVAEAWEHLQVEYRKMGPFATIFASYLAQLFELLTHRHPALTRTLRATAKLQRLADRVIKAFVTTPKTSTLLQHAPEHNAA